MPDRHPLVSCVMPTYNRRRFIPQALRCFANRTYRNAELIVVDDSQRPVRNLCEGVEGVRYVRVPITSAGEKLNIGIKAARGDIIQNIDDDDYYGPRFLESSVEHLSGQDPARTLVTRCCFLTLIGSDGILRHSRHGWKTGGAFCFHRDLWRRSPYPDLDLGYDSRFRRTLDPEVVLICDAEQYIVVRHGANTWNRVQPKGSQALGTDEFLRRMEPYEKSPARLLNADELAFYRRLLKWRP